MNIGAVLRDEIRRLARKEIKLTHPGLKKDLTHLKRSFGRLMKHVQTFEKVAAEFQKSRIEQIKTPKETVQGARFNARLSAKLRSRLRLTREQFAALADVSSNTVYLWEKGKIMPSRRTKGVLAGLRKLRVREAKKLLAAMPSQKPAKARKRGRK